MKLKLWCQRRRYIPERLFLITFYWPPNMNVNLWLCISSLAFEKKKTTERTWSKRVCEALRLESINSKGFKYIFFFFSKAKHAFRIISPAYVSRHFSPNFQMHKFRMITNLANDHIALCKLKICFYWLYYYTIPLSNL